MESNKIINDNCWVAYFDILGFKNRIGELKDNLDVFVDSFYKEISDEAKKSQNYWSDTVFHVLFSDSFIFFTPDDSDGALSKISEVAEYFVWGAIGKKKTLRGALTVGQFYANTAENIFVGPALIDAIDYEKKQDWIGFVLTPKVCDRLRGMSRGLIHDNYIKYNVPVRKNKRIDGKMQIVIQGEELFALRLDKFEHIERNIIEMQKVAKVQHPEKYETEYKAKYENTLGFIKATKSKFCSPTK